MKRAWVLFRDGRPGTFAYDTKESASRVASKGHEVVEMVEPERLRESIAVEMESLLGRCTFEEAVVVRACASIARGRPAPTEEQRAWAERVVAEAKR